MTDCAKARSAPAWGQSHQGGNIVNDTSDRPLGCDLAKAIISRRMLLASAAVTAGAGAVYAATGGQAGAAGRTLWGTGRSVAGADLGTVTLGGAFTAEVAQRALDAALATTGLDVEVNNVDRDTWVENFNSYLQQPDDVIQWYAGYRMRAFASKGVIGDVTALWEGFDGFSEGFKNASTALDGRQYFVPFTFYPWGVFYRKSLFEENGYTVPEAWADFIALCEQMQADGIVPIASCNDGNWPQMGWFDMINMRTNGYDFHISLMGGKESWTDDRVKAVFATWSEVLHFYQENFASRGWQEAATSIGAKEAGVFLLGSFMVSNFDPVADPSAQEIIDDIDFFLFPAIDEEHGQDAIEAPIDGWLMALEPENPEGAAALLTAFGGVETADAWVANEPTVLPANQNADTSGFTALQQRSLELVGAATYISQFLDRDTDPDFAATVIGPAIADFLAGGDVDSILDGVEARKSTYVFE